MAYLGWNGANANGLPAGDEAPSDWSGSVGVDTVPAYFMKGGVVGPTTGAIVWGSRWAPTDPGDNGNAPTITTTGDVFSVSAPNWFDRVSRGVLEITASDSNGVISGTLRATFTWFSPYFGVYGNVAWEVADLGPVVIPDFWANFVYTREVP